MSKQVTKQYQVEIFTQQDWVSVYNVTAKSSKDAETKAVDMFAQGEKPVDNDLENEAITGTYAQEVIK